MSRKTPKRQGGFSLIEVLFAIFLSAMCALVLAAGMPIANSSRARADYYNKATGLAQKQIEAIRTIGYPNATASQLATVGLIDSAEPIATNTFSFTNVDSASLDNPARILPSGTGRVTLEQIDLDLRRVTVEIRWMDRSVQKSVKVGTLIANL